MTKNPKILSIVLAGGEGTRLMPLTRDRAKPAVPFGGVYRLIDFPLSNLVNSGYRQVVVLTQYKSHSLDRHISQVWRFSPLLGSYVSPVPAQQRLGKHWYLGSADAIYQTINIIEDGRIVEKKHIAVSAGTLSTSNGMFVFLLIFIVLLVGALSFFPALALGPIAEHLTLWG